MTPQKITCKPLEKHELMREDPRFGITRAALQKYGQSSWSFLQRFRIDVGDYVWHGFLKELPPDTDNGLLAHRWVAGAFGIEDSTKATIAPSNASEIRAIQYEEAQTEESPIGAVEGLELQIGDRCRFRSKTIRITACDPGGGYITGDTYWEDINQDPEEDDEGEGEPVVEQLECVTPARSTSGFDKLIGMDDVIREVEQKILLPYQKPDLAQKYMHKPLKGALIYGPNGVGKTALVRAIAEEANVSLIAIPSGVDLESLVEAYESAAKKKKGCIVFIDEIDGLFKTGMTGAGNPFVTTLQECIDGYSQNDGVFTIGTTNFPGSIPQGLRRSGRLDVLIEISLPSQDARKKLFDYFLRGLKTSEDIKVSELARKTNSFTGGDIEAVVKEAGIAAMAAHQRNAKAKINSKRLKKVISGYTPTGARIMGLQKPNVSFDDIHGQDELIQSITTQLDFISGKKEAKYSNISNEAILLHGPPGTGKTFMAQAIANYLGVSFLYKKGASFKDKWVGETERNIRKMFAQARTFKPVLIFIDEIDGIGKKRTGGDWNRHSEDALSVFLGEMEGVVGNEGIYLVGATNVPEQLDEAVLSRFRRKIPVPKPDSSQRRAVLQGLFETLPQELVQLDYDAITEATEGYTQRKLTKLYDKVCLKLDIGQASKVTTAFLQTLIQPTQNINNNQLHIAQ